ncbi:hypothetical protein AAHC03_010248 [Spirometra sp. Aus1]
MAGLFPSPGIGFFEPPVHHSISLCRSCIVDTGLNTGRQALVCDSERLWNGSSWGSTSTWLKASVDLPPSDGIETFKLILEGTIPAGYPDARICVDNITSYTEPCSALEPKPIKPVSSLNWAHYFGMIFIAALALGLIIPILFLVIIIFVCRRRHQYRHSNFANSKLFSTNLWHYIGGKEVSEDPFAEHTASFHRPPFMGNKFVGDGTLAMRNGDMMDLPDVVIPGGRVVAMGYNGGTLGPNGTMRHQSASFNGYPYGSSTMTMGAKPMMGQPGMGYMQSPMTPNMATSQHNTQTMFQPAHFYNGNVDHMQPQQQAAQPPQPVQGSVANNQPPRVQSGPVQQSAPAVVPPSNYFRSLTQAAEDHPAPVTHAGQPAATANQPVAHPPVSINDHAGNTAASLEDNGLFVLPDPPSDGGQPGAHGSVERDQADALEALNSATEVNVPAAAAPAPRSAVTATSAVATAAAPAGEPVYTGEHPPPGYDEAVGMVPSRRDQQKAALPVPAAAAVAPVLPPRRAGAGGQFAANGQPEAAAGLSLAERYGLPISETQAEPRVRVLKPDADPSPPPVIGRLSKPAGSIPRGSDHKRDYDNTDIYLHLQVFVSDGDRSSRSVSDLQVAFACRRAINKSITECYGELTGAPLLCYDLLRCVEVPHEQPKATSPSSSTRCWSLVIVAQRRHVDDLITALSLVTSTFGGSEIIGLVFADAPEVRTRALCRIDLLGVAESPTTLLSAC